jgi:hypothetical protein
MFIYFPEFFYKNTINYIQSTFRDKFDEKKYEEFIVKELSENENIKNMIKEFNEKKIKFPMISFEHCKPNFFVNQSDSLDLKSLSNYNNIDNRIKLCKNKIDSEEDFKMLLRKEISYAYDINIKYKSKPSYSLQDLSIMSINACTTMMKNISQHRLIKNELIKRCSYLELKYKFREEIKSIYEEENRMFEDLKLNEIIKNLIDQNFA